MADSKFGAPRVTSKDVDAGKVAKLSQRVSHTLKTQTLFHEPTHLDPRSVLVSPMNRNGAPPNVHQIHDVILKGILVNGYDKDRPPAGICVKYESPEGKKALL